MFCVQDEFGELQKIRKDPELLETVLSSGIPFSA